MKRSSPRLHSIWHEMPRSFDEHWAGKVRGEFALVRLLSLGPPVSASPGNFVSTLTAIGMAAGKLLANSDRCVDCSVFSHDVLDLVALDFRPRFLAQALERVAEANDGVGVMASDAQCAAADLRSAPSWLMHCIQALSVRLTLATMQQILQRLARRLTSASPRLEPREWCKCRGCLIRTIPRMPGAYRELDWHSPRWYVRYAL